MIALSCIPEEQFDKHKPDSLNMKQKSEPEEAKPKTLNEYPTTQPSLDKTSFLKENAPSEDEKSAHSASEVQVNKKFPDSLGTEQTSESKGKKTEVLDEAASTIQVEERNEKDIKVDESGKTKNN